MNERAFRRLYVHVPFCRAKCDYCAFYSEAPFRPERFDAYARALDRECERLARASGELRSVFVGGGTPTLAGGRRLHRLLNAIRERFRLGPETEWTVESTPSTLSTETISVLAECGVNRISVGVQTFSERLRRQLGRCDTPQGLADRLAACRAHGIRRLNVDLMFGIPGQTLRQWEADLVNALELGIDHLSTYCLTVEEGTRLASDARQSPDEETAEAMWDLADAVAERYHLRRYEISNFCKPGSACQHNVGVWLGEAYAGCGPAAASFNGITRWQNPASLDDWLAGTRVELDSLPPTARAAEILAFGLRLHQGWQTARFRQITGYDMFELCGDVLERLAQQGLLRVTRTRVHPTDAGLKLNDTVAEAVLLDTTQSPVRS